MEATFSSETSVEFQWATRRYVPENNHRCENLKSYKREWYTYLSSFYELCTWQYRVMFFEDYYGESYQTVYRTCLWPETNYS
jgi:hypothetical protein